MDYKVEDLKFLNMKKDTKKSTHGHATIFEIENELSVAEKINFIDSLHDGIASYLLELFKKWETEKDDLPKGRYNSPKTVSQKAWIKRNDTRKKINTDYQIGSYSLFGTSHSHMGIEYYNHRSFYHEQHVVHQWFHDLCKKLYLDERKYFEDNDPFHIKLKKVREYGDRYSIVFNNTELNDIVWNRKKDVPEKNLDLYIMAYEKLESAMKEIENELDSKINIYG